MTRDDRELPRGFLVGHWTDAAARTGCTVVLAPDGAVGGVDVRGAASGTIGTDSLRPGARIGNVHAVLLTGGSAFGLAATGGVLRYLEERGIGLEVGDVRVPIVAGAVIFDLLVGDARTRPDADAGYGACTAATRDVEVGAIGAGTGATVAKAGSREPKTVGGEAQPGGGKAQPGGGEAQPGGVGIASTRAGDAIVTAIMVVNSVGGIWDDHAHQWIAPLTQWDRNSSLVPGASTTIGVVGTDATLTREQANRVATVAHDGIARAVRPAHTMYDGDTMFCLATGTVTAPYDVVEILAAEVVARAIAMGVRAAQSASSG